MTHAHNAGVRLPSLGRLTHVCLARRHRTVLRCCWLLSRTQTGLVGCSIFGALPLAIAIFPQEIQIPTSALEPEFQNLKTKDGKPLTHVVCNKGL